MSEVPESTPAKQRGRKGAGRRATRSTAKPARAADEDALAEEQEAQPLQSDPAKMLSESQQQESRQQDTTANAAQPATSSMTNNTARQSGRLGSRLTGTHAAIPSGSTCTAQQVIQPVTPRVLALQ
jgi:hypothetical protein